LAEREGFEPSIRYKRIHALQACAFNRSATSPVAPTGTEAWRGCRADTARVPERNAED
jgi:hypothetical protein